MPEYCSDQKSLLRSTQDFVNCSNDYFIHIETAMIPSNLYFWNLPFQDFWISLIFRIQGLICKMTVQQYCLRWNNHQPNFISVFSSLLNNQSLVDVTLAAEGKHLQAHKVVLSACSSYFQVILFLFIEKLWFDILVLVPVYN